MHHGINWGDVPTWLAVVVATFGGYAALRQLRLQQEDLRRQTVQLERKQAEQIILSWQPAHPVEGNADADPRQVWMAVVENSSARPTL